MNEETFVRLIVSKYLIRDGMLLSPNWDQAFDQELVQEYQSLTNKAVQQMIRYFQDPTEDNRSALMDRLTEAAEMSLGIRKRVESQQVELFGGEQ